MFSFYLLKYIHIYLRCGYDYIILVSEGRHGDGNQTNKTGSKEMSEQLMILYKSSSLDRYIMSLELPHTFKRVVKCGSVKVEAFVSQYNYLVEEVDRVKTLIDELNSAIDNSENWLIISWYQSKRNFARYYLESLESDLSAAHMTLHLHKLGFSN